jgi:hypothetical protein
MRPTTLPWLTARSKKPMLEIVPDQATGLYRILWPDIGPSDLSNLTRCKQATLEWAAQSAAPRSRKKIRVMGERDIISATALFAFYDEGSH